MDITKLKDSSKRRWRNLNEWLKAFILALGLLLVLHVLVMRWVMVQSTSMYATLMPGDLLLVQRWAIWTGLERGEVVVFHDPLKDQLARRNRPLLVKRIAGMPGDELELRSGDLYINGEPVPPQEHGTSAYLLRLLPDHDPDSLLEAHALPPNLVSPGRSLLELPLNEAIAQELERSPSVVSAAPMSAATGAPRHIFPFSQQYRWNSDDFGPIKVPAKGDTLQITMHNLPLYDRLISQYEGHTLSVSSGTLLMDGEPLDTYVVQQDYYFVLGDSRHHSADSRYWGFVPDDHVMGRGMFVLLSKGGNGVRKGRFFKRL